jgi:hypothetical protein
MYKAKVAVCPEILTKHSTQSKCHVEFFNVKPCGTEKKLLGFKRLKSGIIRLAEKLINFSKRNLLYGVSK